jgi:hypothetical protein
LNAVLSSHCCLAALVCLYEAVDLKGKVVDPSRKIAFTILAFITFDNEKFEKLSDA